MLQQTIPKKTDAVIALFTAALAADRPYPGLPLIMPYMPVRNVLAAPIVVYKWMLENWNRKNGLACYCGSLHYSIQS